MDPFLTIYKKDYLPKVKCVAITKGFPQEFPDPLMESYKNYLQLSSSKTPPELPIEDCDVYHEKIKTNKPKITTMHLEKPVDNAIMTRRFLENGRTVYQCDFCDIERDAAHKEEIRVKNLFRLPDDYVLPLTIQQFSYRNPVSINSNAYSKTTFGRIPNNLDPQPHIRKLLKTTTGESNYGGTIGNLGDIIINEHLHGKIDRKKCLEMAYAYDL